MVTNVNDAGPGSLRDAMTMANVIPGPDTINFNISGAGPHTIFVLSQLPPLIDRGGVFIDGFSEPSATPGANPPSTANLMIVVDGSNAGLAHGFWIQSSFNTIQGLVIINFEQDGIRIEGTYDGTFMNYIYCNFIGTDQTGTVPQGNGFNQLMLWAGVDIIVTPGSPGFAYDNMVEANLISANYAQGVSISNCPPGDVYQNIVILNYIGTDLTGMIDLGNIHDGVYIGEGAHHNIVDGNLISGNDFEGVCIVGYAEAVPPIMTHSNTVMNNIIGLRIDFTPLPNGSDGVSIGIYGANQTPQWYQGGWAVANMIVGNTIAENGRNGVLVWEHYSSPGNADFNWISQNSIYENGLLGIDLDDDGVTINDPGDPDLSANEGLNFPVIMNADYSAGLTTVAGTLDIDTDPTLATVEVFQARPDPSNYGEGEIYLGSATPDAMGNWTTVVSGVVPGDWVTANTTDMNMNSSEFAENVQVVLTGTEENLAGRRPSYELAQNHPNPFTSSTSIQYAVPRTTQVTLRIYDASGRLVKVLAEGAHSASSYAARWDGKDESGRQVQAGIYFCKLSAAGFESARRMVLLR